MKQHNDFQISIADLERALHEEIHLYEDFAERLAADVDLMSNLKIEDLEKSNKSKATILLKIQSVEEARKILVSKIAQQKGLSSESVRLTDICQTLDAKDSKKLLSLREKLLAVIFRIREIESEAHQLTRSSLTWIEGSMATLRRLLSPTGVYNQKGRIDSLSKFSGRVVENKA
jgi:hypothetical protein